MPYEKKPRKTDKSYGSHKQTQNKPVISISKRKKMTSTQAKTQSIPDEFKTTTVRSLMAGVSYIRNQRDVDNVYILRDGNNRMIKSYSFLNKEWRPINMGGYSGGYRIGNPKPACSCGAGKCEDPLRPIYNC